MALEMSAGVVIALGMYASGVALLVGATVQDVRKARRRRLAKAEHEKIARQLDDCACEATQGHRDA